MRSNKFVKMILLILVSTLLASSMISISLPQSSALKLPEQDWVDGTYAIPWRDSKQLHRPIDLAGGGGPSPPPTDMVIMVGDWGLDIDYAQNFHYVLTGEHCYIYVAYDFGPDPENYYDVLTDEYVFENPNYPTGGWTPEDRISTAQLEYFKDEFDNTMYPIETDIFGMPAERPANETKIYILILNLRDPSYYDATFTWYVAGYFSAGEDAMYNKNMIHIDTYQWWNRVGPGVGRPYLYEIVFAHEFEHLIHYDQDPDEPSWVDEGLADLAGYFCGYGHSAGHIANYLVYHPWTALTFWGNALEDYGASYLFQLYLWEHFGGTPFIMDLVQNPLNGIEGIEDTLQAWGYTISFDQIFHNWAIANYIDDTNVGNGEYGYFTLNIPSPDTWGYSIQYALWNMWIGTEFWRGFGYQASWWPGMPQPYTAHYWEYAFTPAEGEVNFFYGGDPVSGMSAYSGTYHRYGGMGAWVWRQLHQSFPIPAGGATLKFYTYYEIETDWDYFYVEVHDVTMDTWTTLPGLMTTTTLPHPQDNPNTPVGREPMDYDAAGKWHALTDFSPGYYQEQMDLTPFAGHDIELYFVYWTDGAYNEVGAYIDDIEIVPIGFFDDVEAGEDGWTNEGWTRGTGLVPNNWEGMVFSVTGIDKYREDKFRYNMRTGKMVNFQPGKLHFHWSIEAGSLTIPQDYVNVGHLYVAVFWNAAPHIISGDYGFGTS